MKKVFIVSSLALSALSLSTFASTEKDIMRGDSTAAPKYTGIYGGIHLGFAPSTLATDHYDNATRKWTKEKTASTSTAMGGVHVGYQYTCPNCLVLGVEGFADMRNIKKINKLPGGANNLPDRKPDRFEKYESDFAYGAAIKIGAKIRNWMPYAKVGIDLSKFEYYHNDKYFFKHHPAVPATHDKPAKAAFNEYAYHVNKDSHNHKGLLLALGVSYDLNERFTVGAEFKHTMYEAKTYTPSPQKSSSTRKVRPSVSSIIGTLTCRL